MNNRPYQRQNQQPQAHEKHFVTNLILGFFRIVGELLGAGWNAFENALDENRMSRGIDGLARVIGPLFRTYDLFAGIFGMIAVGYAGGKTIAGVIFAVVNVIMFYISNKIARGYIKQEAWWVNMDYRGKIVVAVLGFLVMFVDAFIMDSTWVFVLFDAPSFFAPLKDGVLLQAFTELSPLGAGIYIASALISSLSEFADLIFRGESQPIQKAQSQPAQQPVTPAPTNTPRPAYTPPAPTNTPRPAYTPPAPTNTPRPAPTNTPRPAPTNTPRPAPTNTPRPAYTPPAPTPKPNPGPTFTPPEPTYHPIGMTQTPATSVSMNAYLDPDQSGVPNGLVRVIVGPGQKQLWREDDAPKPSNYDA